MKTTDTRTIRSQWQLISALGNIKGGTLVTLTTLTSVQMDDFRIHGKVLKWCRQTMQVGVSYENAINTRLGRIGFDKSFKSDSLPYGRWVIPNRVIKHNGQYYGRFYPVNNDNKKVCYFIDGRIATARESEIISNYEIYVKPYSTKQARYGLTENQVNLRNYRFDSILELNAEGKSYKVEFSRRVASVTR